MKSGKLDLQQNIHQHLIRRLREFHSISSIDEKLIEQAFKLKKFKSGESLIESGKVTRELFFVISGVLKVTRRSSALRAEVIFFIKNNNIATFLYSAYGNIPAYHGLKAACNTEVLVLDADEWIKLYDQLPYMRTVIDEIMILFMAEMYLQKELSLKGSAYQNYKLLLKNESEIARQVALSDVASYLGITPQSLSRIRRAYASSQDI